MRHRGYYPGRGPPWGSDRPLNLSDHEILMKPPPSKKDGTRGPSTKRGNMGPTKWVFFAGSHHQLQSVSKEKKMTDNSRTHREKWPFFRVGPEISWPRSPSTFFLRRTCASSQKSHSNKTKSAYTHPYTWSKNPCSKNHLRKFRKCIKIAQNKNHSQKQDLLVYPRKLVKGPG